MTTTTTRKQAPAAPDPGTRPPLVPRWVMWTGLAVGAAVGLLVIRTAGVIAFTGWPVLDWVFTVALVIALAVVAVDLTRRHHRRARAATWRGARSAGRGARRGARRARSTAGTQWASYRSSHTAPSQDDTTAPPEPAKPQPEPFWRQPAPAPATNGDTPVTALHSPAPRPAAGSGTPPPLTRPIGNPRQNRPAVSQRAAVHARRLVGDRPLTPEWAAVVGGVVDLDAQEDVEVVEMMLDIVAGLAALGDGVTEQHESLLQVNKIDPKSIALLEAVPDLLLGCADLLAEVKAGYIEHHELPNEYVADGGILPENASEFITGHAGDL